MKAKFEVVDIALGGKILYKTGSIEIDDEACETTLKANKTLSIFGINLPLGKKEVYLEKTRYDAKTFPQFEDNELKIGEFSFIVPNEEERVKIKDMHLKPLLDLRFKIDQELTKVENKSRELLLRRAQAIEYIDSLKANPRKTLFTYSPEILSEFENPVQIAIQQQKDAVAAMISQLKEEIIYQINNQNLTQSNIEKLQKFIIAVGMLQNAIFEKKQDKISSVGTMLKDMGLLTQENCYGSIKELTEMLTQQFIPKMHQDMLDGQLGIACCSSCGKYFLLNMENRCTYCKTFRQQNK